jgi:F0F1-type ATP synthase epsilon subunit
MQKKSVQKLLEVIVNDEDKGVVWSGEATAVSSINSQGEFDILPQHANFITLIEGHPIYIAQTTGRRELVYPAAVIYAESDKVSIYVISGPKT